MSRTPASVRQVLGDDASLQMAIRPGCKTGRKIELTQTRGVGMIQDGRLNIYVKYEDQTCDARLVGFPSRCGGDLSSVSLEISLPHGAENQLAAAS